MILMSLYDVESEATGELPELVKATLCFRVWCVHSVTPLTSICKPLDQTIYLAFLQLGECIQNVT